MAAGKSDIVSSVNVAVTAASTVAKALASNRQKIQIVNNTNRPVTISYVDPAVLNEGAVLGVGDMLIEKIWTGELRMIGAVGVAGNVHVTEFK